MWPDKVLNLGALVLGSDALPTVPCGLAFIIFCSPYCSGGQPFK